MASEITICNRALSNLGVQRITSLSEGTKQARECNLHYAEVRDELLQEFEWPFATKRAELALLSETQSGWDYAYAYPNDCLVARRIYDASTGDNTDNLEVKPTIPFEVALSESETKKVVLTDQEDAELIYTKKVTAPGLFPPDFTTALILKLSSVLAMPLRQKEALSASMFNLYQRVVSQAKANLANESNRRYRNTDSILDARG